jgi:endonuclease YncB( thermonuclease family)
MSYTLLAGEFVIRYPDLPRQGPEPDGDTIKFTPDTPALVEALPRVSGQPPGLNARGISVRLEAIDTLETHFSETHQELAGANAARDRLLELLGFTNVVFFDDLPNKVKSADQDHVRGHVLSNGIDANGRMIGFVYAGDAADPDGSQIFLEPARAGQSANATQLAEGQAYAAFYSSLPAELRTFFAGISRAARDANPPAGIMARSTADPNGAATVMDLAGLEALVMWPKVFRRLVPFLATGATSFDGFDAWLRADPVNRDDAIFLLDRLEHGNLHDVIVGAGHTIQLTVWPEDFIIGPDPAPGGGTGGGAGGTTVAAGSVLIVAALPDPTGADAGHETVTLLNVTADAIPLNGWALADNAGGQQALQGQLAAGDTVRVGLSNAVQLGNRGDTVRLLDGHGTVIDRVVYQANQVHAGRTIAFTR